MFSLSILLIILTNFNAYEVLDYIPIKVTHLNETHYNINKNFVIFEYEIEYTRNGSIFFIFNKGNRPTTKIYFYNSYSKIIKTDSGFINYKYAKILDKKYIELSIDYFYNTKSLYIVIFDNSLIYEDSLYITNPLIWIHLQSNFMFSCPVGIKEDIHFHFMFYSKFEEEYYLHLQALQIKGFFVNEIYYFKIFDEKDESFIDKRVSGANDYIKLKPNVTYFINVVVVQNPNYDDIQTVKLSFLKYGKNIWMKDNKLVKLDALTSQYFTFFKNISGVNIDDPVYFYGESTVLSNAEERFYVKYYESDNFERLVDNLPTNQGEFDKEIGFLQKGGNFQFELAKNYSTQKGILIGVFIDYPFTWLVGIQYTSLKIRFSSDIYDEKEEEEEKEEKEKEKEREEREREKEEKEKEEKEREKEEKEREKEKEKKREREKEKEEKEKEREKEKEKEREEKKKEKEKEKEKEREREKEKEEIKKEDNNKIFFDNNLVIYLIIGIIAIIVIIILLLIIILSCRSTTKNNTVNYGNISLGNITNNAYTEINMPLNNKV